VNARQITSGGQNGRPAWSPDCRYLLFNAISGGHSQIVRIALDGSGYTVISKSFDDEQPDWSAP
jgi:Tol biopolymer transport system component